MHILVLIIVILILSLAIQPTQTQRLTYEEELFWQFNDKYDFMYSSIEEEYYRLNNFVDNLRLLKQYNDNDLQAKYGISKFFNLSPQEFASIYLNLKSIEQPTAFPKYTITNKRCRDFYQKPR